MTAAGGPGPDRSAPAAPCAETLETLSTLIGFPTVSRDSNLGLIEWVRDRLAGHGVRSRLTYDGRGCKANLFATVGDRPGPGLILSGHTDVVPTDGQAWSSDPFVARLREDRLYGRGAADMKGFIAAVLAAIPAMLAAEGEPFHIALSYDEEVGCVGVRELITDLVQRGVRPRGCIIGEPTGMRPVLGHKGSAVYCCHVHGREAHSSLAPDGVNAIEAAARLIVELGEIRTRLERTERPHPGFDVPRTTIGTNLISGGVASNIVPRDCEFRLDIRTLPGTRADAVVDELTAFSREWVVPEMRRVEPDSRVVFKQMGEVPALQLDPAHELAVLTRRLLSEPQPDGYVGFGTEGGLFQQAGIPSIVCGPGSIDQAHRPDEFISLGQLAACEGFLGRLIALGDERAFGDPHGLVSMAAARA